MQRYKVFYETPKHRGYINVFTDDVNEVMALGHQRAVELLEELFITNEPVTVRGYEHIDERWLQPSEGEKS